MQRTIALVDVNNFYVSCERAFNPAIRHKPVVVLSNNDGCAIARSNEVKALGIGMGAPWFQMREMAERHGIIAYSSNFPLYADMSQRVMRILSEFSPDQEVYSIDECFLDLTEFQSRDLIQYGHEMRNTILQWTGLPVCVGIGSTKTLAKLANHCAKKRSSYQGVCNLNAMSSDEVDEIMKSIAVEEVWGIGRRLTEQLNTIGIKSVFALKTADVGTLRTMFSVNMERTIRELRGVACIEMQYDNEPKQQIVCAKSFGTEILDIVELSEAITDYMARAACKLREQGSTAGKVHVWLQTNPFKPDQRYSRALSIPLPEHTDNTVALTRCALDGLNRLYLAGYLYKKVGVMLDNLAPSSTTQAHLFAVNTALSDKQKLLSKLMDRVNIKYGRNTIKLASAGVSQNWQAQRNYLSQQYTTDWSQVMKTL